MIDKNRIVVFDLDETIGSFSELGMFWNSIENILGNQDEKCFFETLDLFQEFLRPKIMNIMKFINERKKDGSCDKVMIYTNNQGPRKWAKMITKYFDSKLKTSSFFDQIIAAFKVNGDIVEICRTTHEKNINDFFSCTRISNDTEICFLDDRYHSEMNKQNVYYIKLKPYTFSLSFKEMATRYYDNIITNNNNTNKNEFINRVVEHMSRYNYKHTDKSSDELVVDTVISKQILIHLKEFFKKKHNHTVKKNITRNSRTRKRKSKRKNTK